MTGYVCVISVGKHITKAYIIIIVVVIIITEW
jgi:hypothetical protein